MEKKGEMWLAGEKWGKLPVQSASVWQRRVSMEWVVVLVRGVVMFWGRPGVRRARRRLMVRVMKSMVSG